MFRKCNNASYLSQDDSKYVKKTHKGTNENGSKENAFFQAYMLSSHLNGSLLDSELL
jgi:hypothetical protein